MFEYTALVDAPVQRFTGIVTGSDPDDGGFALAADEPAPPLAKPVADAPADLALPPRAAVLPRSEHNPRPAPPRHVPPVASSGQPPVQPRVRPAAAAAPTLSFRPALIAIVAAGVTAMWWLRRESHDR